MKTVLCSHGFGVKADSKGMFTAIAAAFPAIDFRMFDLNDERPDGDTYVRPLDGMAAELQDRIDIADGEIILLCHSLGCVVAGLVDTARVSKIVLLAPPDKIDHERYIARLRSRKGSEIDLSGMSVLPRTDGSTTYLPKEFFASVANADLMELYRKIAADKPTVIIRALQDEMIGLTKIDTIKNARIVDLDTDHNFTGEGRQKLIGVLCNIL